MSCVRRARSATAKPSAANRRARAAPLPGPTPTTAHTGLAGLFRRSLALSLPDRWHRRTWVSYAIRPGSETVTGPPRTATMAFARVSRARRFLLPVLVASGAMGASAPGRAHACGAGSGGAAGITGCSLAEHEEEARPKWRSGRATRLRRRGFISTPAFASDEIPQRVHRPCGLLAPQAVDARGRRRALPRWEHHDARRPRLLSPGS